MDAQLAHLRSIAEGGIAGQLVRLGIVPRGAELQHAKHGFNVYENDGYAEANEETIAGALSIIAPELVEVYRRCSLSPNNRPSMARRPPS